MIDATEFYQVLVGNRLVAGERGMVIRGKKGNTLVNDRVLQRLQGEYYLLVASVSGRIDGGMARRTRDDLRHAHMLVMDDIGTKSEAPHVTPTWVIETSPGNYQWGFLLKPWSLDDDGMDIYENAVKACISAGWSDGGAGGAYRIVRMPGSVNVKPGRENFPARILSWEPDREWSLPELCTALKLEDLGDTDAQPRQRPATGLTRIIGYIDPVLKWLTDQGLVTGPVTNDWVELAQCPWLVDAKSEGGHQTGDTAFYSPAGRGGGSLSEMRAFKCHHNHPEADTPPKTPEFMAWVVECGGPRCEIGAGGDLLAWRYCLIESGSMVGDMHATAKTVLPISKLADFRNSRRVVVGMLGNQKIFLDAEWLSGRETKRLTGLAYQPGQGRVIQHMGSECFNTWGAPEHADADASPGVFLAHLQHVVPHDWGVFLDWLAFKLQHPERRSFAIIMVADSVFGNVYGIGRSMIVNVIQNLFQAGVPSLDLSDLIGSGSQSQFNEWASDAQIVCVEETKEEVGDWRSKTDAYEKLKKLVDVRVTEGVRVKIKYGPTFYSALHANFLFLTNHVDAIKLPADDRRFMVMQNAVVKRTPAEYAAMDSFIRSPAEIGQLFHWLMARDVSGFDQASPPLTAAKISMQDLGQSSGDRLLDEAVDTLHDVVSKKQLIDRVTEICNEEYEDPRGADLAKGAARRLWLKLPKPNPGAGIAGRLRDTGGAQDYVRLIRNVEEHQLAWANANLINTKKAYIKNCKNIRRRGGSDIEGV